MRFEDLTPEQKEKVKACKNVDELMAIAKEEGHELSSEELEAVSGGEWNCWDICTKYEKPNTCRVKDCSPFGIA